MIVIFIGCVNSASITYKVVNVVWNDDSTKGIIRVLSDSGKILQSETLYTATCGRDGSSIFAFAAYNEVWLAVKGKCSVEVYPQRLVNVHVKQVDGVGCSVALWNGGEYWFCKKKPIGRKYVIENEATLYEVDNLLTAVASDEDLIVVVINDATGKISAKGLLTGKEYPVQVSSDLGKKILPKPILMYNGYGCTELIGDKVSLWKYDGTKVVAEIYDKPTCGVKNGRLVPLTYDELKPYAKISDQGTTVFLPGGNEIKFDTLTFVIDSPRFSCFEN